MTSRIVAIFSIFLAFQQVSATTMGIPAPKVMLEKSDVVGVASLRKESYQWQVRFSKVLKGKPPVDVWISLDKPLSLDLDMFGKMIGNDPFLFLAFDKKANGHLMPAYWLVSAWPQGKPRDSRLETLEGCVAFAKTVLAGQQAAGENTMPENAVLPPALSEAKLKELRKEEEAEAVRKVESKPTGPLPPSVEVTTNPAPELPRFVQPPVDAEAVPLAEKRSPQPGVIIGMASVVILVVSGCYYWAAKRKRG